MAAELWAWQGGTPEAEYLGSASMGQDGTSVFAGHTFGNWSGTNAGGLDRAAVKLTADGDEMWRYQSGTAVHDRVFGSCIDEDGSVYLAGTVDNDTTATDFSVIKLDPLGNELWSFEASTDGQDNAHDVDVAQDGGVIVVGHTSGTWNTSPAGLLDFAAFRLDADGVEVWRYQDGTDEDDWFYGVAIADDNTVVMVGYTAGDFGAANAGSDDIVAVKLNATDGQEIWRYQNGTIGVDRFNEVAFFGDDGSIVLAGMTQGDLVGTGNGQEDFAVLALDSSGAFIWAWQDGTPEDDRLFGSTATEGSCITLTGITEGAWSGPSAGADDLAVVKLCDGQEVWRYQGGTAGEDVSWASAAHPDGRLVLAGYTDGNWSEGLSPGGDDFLVVMLDTTASGASDAASVPGAAGSSSDITPTVVGGIVAAVAALCIALALTWVVLKKRREKDADSTFMDSY